MKVLNLEDRLESWLKGSVLIGEHAPRVRLNSLGRTWEDGSRPSKHAGPANAPRPKEQGHWACPEQKAGEKQRHVSRAAEGSRAD